MSDRDLARALDEMERLLNAQPSMDHARALENWRMRFAEAAASAERGPAWESLVQRARHLGARVNALLENLQQQQEELRKELDHQAQGSRALRAYRPSGN